MKRLRWAAHSKGNFAGAGALYFWLVFKINETFTGLAVSLTAWRLFFHLLK
jgi:hypothetical protein